MAYFGRARFSAIKTSVAKEDRQVSDSEAAKDELESCSQWIASIPREDARLMHHTREYREFMRALESLHQVHRKVATWNQNRMMDDDFDLQDLEAGSNFSFLQHMAADDIILRVMEFLECQMLIRTMKTCSRFRELAQRSARQRTQHVAKERQLNNALQLLRAKEQIEGIGTSISDSHVRVPTLLLSRRVHVFDCGDPEYNGIYYCTGSNGNGFVFTKPRHPELRVHRSSRLSTLLTEDVSIDASVEASRLESEVAGPGRLLRCIIAKRFSNETLLWYCSKEVVALESNGEVEAGDVTQVFSFWAKLMVIGDATPDICQYPSQSSILASHQDFWQTLPTIPTTQPPTVELLD